jgi:hypothetical protein
VGETNKQHWRAPLLWGELGSKRTCTAKQEGTNDVWWRRLESWGLSALSDCSQSTVETVAISAKTRRHLVEGGWEVAASTVILQGGRRIGRVRGSWEWACVAAKEPRRRNPMCSRVPALPTQPLWVGSAWGCRLLCWDPNCVS